MDIRVSSTSITTVEQLKEIFETIKDKEIRSISRGVDSQSFMPCVKITYLIDKEVDKMYDININYVNEYVYSLELAQDAKANLDPEIVSSLQKKIDDFLMKGSE